VVTTILCVACGQADDPSPRWSVADSADMRALVFHGGVPEAVRIPPEQVVLRLASPPDGLARVVDGAIGPEDFYLVDGSARRIFRYDEAGRFLEAIGRPGEGPGEFLDPISVSLVGDTLHVLDRRRSRVIRYLRDGGWLSEASTGPLLSLRAAPFGDGSGDAIVSLEPRGPRSADTDQAVFMGSSVSVLLRRPPSPPMVLLRERGPDEIRLGTTTLPTPFGLRPLIETHPKGVVFSGGARYDLYVLGADGEVLGFRWPSAGPPISDREWDSLRTAILDGAVAGSSHLVEAMFVPAARPDPRPWIGRLAVDPSSGVIWTQGLGAFSSTTPHVFSLDLESRTIRHLIVPEDAVLLDVRSNLMLLLRVDPVGIQHVELLDVSGPG